MLHKKECNIILATGEFKRANEICIGDLILGPDSKSRKVIKINRRKCPLAITTKNNQVLYAAIDSNIFLESTTTKPSEKNAYPLHWCNLISEYFNKSNNFRHLYKLKSVNVDFKYLNRFDISPYHLGIILGDGGITAGVNVTSENIEIVNEINKLASCFDLNIAITCRPNNKSKTYNLVIENHSGKKNPLKQVLRNLNLLGTNSGNKFVPQFYKTSSFEDRVEILAGLMDTDGSKESNGFDYITKSNLLSEDITFIARSLGLKVYKTKCIKRNQFGFEGEYNRLFISGHTDIIPCRLESKRCTKRKQKKNPNRTGFDIEKIKSNEIYYEIKVDGDGLYLDENFIILT